MLKLQSTVVTDTMVKSGVPCESQPLTGIDILHGYIGVPVMLVYPQGLDLDKALNGLKETLKKYPLLCGRLRKGKDGQVFIDACDEGLQWRVLQCKGPTPVGEHRPPLGDIGAFYKALMPWQAVGGKEPIMQISIHMFEDGGSVMLLRCPHVMLDGSSAFGFLLDWARACYGMPVFGQDPDRSQLIKLGQATPLPKQPLPMLYKPPLLKFMGVMLRLGWRAAFQIRKEVFRIPAAQIKAWQEQAKAMYPDEAPPSSARLASAFVFQAVDHLLPANEPRYMGLVLDMRYAKGFGLPRNYFGNGLCSPEARVEASDIQGSLIDLARKLSPDAEQTKVETLKQIAAVLEDARQKNEVTRLMLGAGERNLGAGIFQNNCSLLPVYDFDFGTGRPRWYDTMAMTIRTMTLLPTPDRDGGIDIHFSARQSERDALKAALAKAGMAPHPGQVAAARA